MPICWNWFRWNWFSVRISTWTRFRKNELCWRNWELSKCVVVNLIGVKVKCNFIKWILHDSNNEIMKHELCWRNWEQCPRVIFKLIAIKFQHVFADFACWSGKPNLHTVRKGAESPREVVEVCTKLICKFNSIETRITWINFDWNESILNDISSFVWQLLQSKYSSSSSSSPPSTHLICILMWKGRCCVIDSYLVNTRIPQESLKNPVATVAPIEKLKIWKIGKLKNWKIWNIEKLKIWKFGNLKIGKWENWKY